jgi:hypothetical protein
MASYAVATGEGARRTEPVADLLIVDRLLIRYYLYVHSAQPQEDENDRRRRELDGREELFLPVIIGR